MYHGTYICSVEDDIEDAEGADVNVEGTARWACRFQYLLESEEGCRLFSKFLKTIFCDENLMFWQESQSIKHLKDDEVGSAERLKHFFNFWIPSCSLLLLLCDI